MQEIPDLPARFVKMILPSAVNLQKLRIPNKFAEKYEHELSDAIKITNHNGDIWHVRLEKEEMTLWLHSGWEKFIKDHSISYGYFLLFEYRGNSCFNVHVFDLTATEVQYPVNNSLYIEGTNHCTRSSIPEIEDVINNSASFPDNPVVCFLRSDAPNELAVQATNGRRHDHQTMHNISFSSTAHQAEERKIVAAERSKSQRCHLRRSKYTKDERWTSKMENLDISSYGKSNIDEKSQSSFAIDAHLGKKVEHAAGNFFPKDLLFTVVLKPINLPPSMIMSVPATFAEYLPSSQGYIKLLDSDGNKWLIRSIIRNRRLYALGRGWGTFLKQKNLMVGDTCVFMLIQINKPLLKVCIFRNTSRAPK